MSRRMVVCLLTVRIKEGQDVPLSDAGTQQPGSDQAFPLWLPHHTDDLKLVHKHFKLLLQVVYGKTEQRTLSKYIHTHTHVCT